MLARQSARSFRPEVRSGFDPPRGLAILVTPTEWAGFPAGTRAKMEVLDKKIQNSLFRGSHDLSDGGVRLACGGCAWGPAGPTDDHSGDCASVAGSRRISLQGPAIAGACRTRRGTPRPQGRLCPEPAARPDHGLRRGQCGRPTQADPPLPARPECPCRAALLAPSTAR